MKRKVVLLMTCVMVLCLTACAKTPDQKLVAQKNNERLEEAAKKEPKEGTTLKDVAATTTSTYDYHYESEDGAIKIVADHAPLTLPVKDSIPMYHVCSGEFSQEFVTKVYDYFFPDGDSYITTGTDVTKSVIDKQIVEIQQTISKVKDDSELSEEEKQGIISDNENVLKSMKESRKDAPEESTLRYEKKDASLVEKEWDGLDGHFTTKGLDVQSRDLKRWLAITSADADSPVSSSITYKGESEYDYSGMAGVPVSQCTEVEKNDVGIKEEDARAFVDDFIEKTGVSWELHDTLLVSGYKSIASDKPDGDIENAESYTAYKFIYAQSVDGIQTAVTSSHYLPDEDDVSLTWLYEQISVVVEKDGIVELEWDFPQMMEDTVSENVGIISFEEASDIFEQMIPLTTKGDLEQWNDVDYLETTVDATVTDVRLGLMRVRDGGSDRRGLLTPVWIFYGDYTRHFHYLDNVAEDHSDSEPQPWILLAVNAVDGSVIDITAGY